MKGLLRCLATKGPCVSQGSCWGRQLPQLHGSLIARSGSITNPIYTSIWHMQASSPREFHQAPVTPHESRLHTHPPLPSVPYRFLDHVAGALGFFQIKKDLAQLPLVDPEAYRRKIRMHLHICCHQKLCNRATYPSASTCLTSPSHHERSSMGD